MSVNKLYGGYTISQLHEMIRSSDEMEVSLDDIVCDCAASANIIRDLLEEVEKEQNSD